MTLAPRLLGIAEAFDAIFIDQFGVLHDGRRPYPGAVEALCALQNRGAMIVVLSNSGRSGEANARRLSKLGFERAFYDHLVTSGDVAKRLLESERSPLSLSAGTRCMTLASDEDFEFAHSLGVRATKDGAEADLVIISGSQGDRLSLEAYRKMLGPAATRSAPCLCANPDKVMLTPNGLAFGAGRIAELYEELGGAVIWVGKPFPPIYQAAAALIGVSDPGRILCIGDSVEHDIVGAHRFGAVAALVRTGILADLSDQALAAEFKRHGETPNFILKNLFSGD